MNERYESPNEGLEAWRRGELDEEQSRLFLEEASRSADLRAEVERHDRLLAALAELPRELEPERDLWPEIAARTLARRPARPYRWLAAGLAAGALIALGALRWVEWGAAPPEVTAARPTPGAALPAPAAARSAPVVENALAHFSETDAELARIREELRLEVGRLSAALPPATRELVFANLATIDRAIEEIEAALAERPGDAALARTYIGYRQRQIDLLRRVNRAASRL